MAAVACHRRWTRVSDRFFAVTGATDIASDLSIMPLKDTLGRHAAAEVGVGRAITEVAMGYSYWRTERLIVDAVDRRMLQKSNIWDRVASIVTDPDLLVLTLICIIGLLLSLVVTLAVPGFAEATEALQQFL